MAAKECPQAAASTALPVAQDEPGGSAAPATTSRMRSHPHHQDHRQQSSDGGHDDDDDFMLSAFATRDREERAFIGDCLFVRGAAPREDIAQMRQASLMAGADAWLQLIACATALMESDQQSVASGAARDPLASRDVFGFVARIWADRDKADKGRRSSRHRHAGSAEVVSPDAVGGGGETGSSGVASEDASQSGQGNRLAGKAVKRAPKRTAASPYWSITPVSGDDGVALALNPQLGAREAKRQRKKAKRRVRRQSTQNSCQLVGNYGTSVLPAENTVAPVAKAVVERDYPEDVFVRVDAKQEALEVPASIPSAEKAAGEETPEDEGKQVSGIVGVQDPTVGKILSQESDGSTQVPPSSANTSNEVGTLTVKEEIKVTIQPETPRRITRSSFFTTPSKQTTAASATPLSSLKSKSPRPPRGTVSCLPFPRLDVPCFGLAQERYTHDPFRLLVAVTFLIRTAGKTALPVFHKLMEQYPTARDLGEAEPAEIEVKIRHLGLSNNRTATIQKYARLWEDNPPRPGVRYGVKNYPRQGDGRDVRAGERLESGDVREAAWEIGHLTQGRYAIDSWRIFCRDVFLGRTSNNDQGGGDAVCPVITESATKTTKAKSSRRKQRTETPTPLSTKTTEEGVFQPEWMRVLPEDKELRAYLRWMWMREGWEWDPLTGERAVLSCEMYEAVQEERVVWDNSGKLVIVPRPPTAEGVGGKDGDGDGDGDGVRDGHVGQTADE